MNYTDGVLTQIKVVRPAPDLIHFRDQVRLVNAIEERSVREQTEMHVWHSINALFWTARIGSAESRTHTQVKIVLDVRHELLSEAAATKTARSKNYSLSSS